MNYPVWLVPHIGSGWVIGIIAIIHVMISHFAVGGGLYLPMAERKARREGREDWMKIVKGHSKFFLILTGVYGAMTGVAIWFAIGLASPEGTSALIHNFVFGWAIEWCFFFIELTSAIVYYYTWDRVSDKLHNNIGWLYAGASLLTLVIINGILTFMLTPSSAWLEVANTGEEATRFWQAFFNPTYWPSLFLRTLVCLALAGMWALVTASRIDGFDKPKLKAEFVRWSVRWLVPAFLFMPFMMLWYYYMIPTESRDLINIGVGTMGSGVFTQVTRAALVTIMTSATILGVVYLFAYRNPREFGLGQAVCILILGLAATAATEQTREMLRKPFVISHYMYSNGVRVDSVDDFNKDGYLTNTIWATDAEREAWAKQDAQLQSGIALAADTTENYDAHLRRGELMMRGQCLACHTLNGYRPLRRFLAGRDRDSIGNILKMLHDRGDDSPYRAFMPPLVGLQTERDALGDYLATLVAEPKPQSEEVVAALP